MKFGNDSKIGLATLIPAVLLLGALVLFGVALWINDGDVEKASVWAAAVAVGFFGLLATMVRLSQTLVAKKDTSEPPAPAAPKIAVPPVPAIIGRDPLDPPEVDEPPAAPTDAHPV